ncbi:Acyl-CoA dehydrogenase C-terminal domain-containing protein [Fibrobacter succinogenes]|nr:Acyl-CoA dehydrogenase C-terminal domain-containing protein [Fibrobacter succinogenes]
MSRVGESEAQAERSYKAANCVMSQRLLRDATKSPELFDKSMKVYLNLAEAEVAKHYNFVKSLSVESMESYKQT